MESSRYPHKVRYTPISGGAYNPATGSYDSTTKGANVELVCRATPNGNGKYIQKIDGKKVEYAFDLGFPLGVAPPPEKSIVEIIGVNGETMHKGELLRCQVGVFSIRGWV